MRYFAWAAHGSEPAFVGPVNPHSGKRSQAGSLSAFDWRSDRDSAFCADVREMLDEGKDPMDELARECERRATQ